MPIYISICICHFFFIVAEGPYMDVVKLQTMRCLFEAYEHVLSLLENVFTPMFCHSDEVSVKDLKSSLKVTLYWFSRIPCLQQSCACGTEKCVFIFHFSQYARAGTNLHKKTEFILVQQNINRIKQNLFIFRCNNLCISLLLQNPFYPSTKSFPPLLLYLQIWCKSNLCDRYRTLLRISLFTFKNIIVLKERYKGCMQVPSALCIPAAEFLSLFEFVHVNQAAC